MLVRAVLKEQLKRGTSSAVATAATAAATGGAGASPAATITQSRHLHALPPYLRAAAAEANTGGERQTFVQKFGGTSLGTREKLDKVVNIVSTNLKVANLACVVSAISSETKSAGTTSRLLHAAEAAVSEQPFQHYLNAIEDTHLDIIYSMVRTHAHRDAAKQHVLGELRNVRQFCESLTVIRELSPRSHDMIVGCGERLSAGMITAVLQEEGIPAVYVNLSHLFKSPLDATRVGYHISAINAIRESLRPYDLDNAVPVITGYMGDVAGGIINGIGRGYSDLTAVLTSAALNADALQVWKESDGIFTANPTKVDTAKLLHVVSPREAAELTYFGNEVRTCRVVVHVCVCVCVCVCVGVVVHVCVSVSVSVCLSPQHFLSPPLPLLLPPHRFFIPLRWSAPLRPTSQSTS